MTEETKATHEFYVAGVKFHELKHCTSEIKVGDTLSMVAEPTNKFDPNAVRLEFNSLNQDRSFMTGYVPAKISASVSAALVVGSPKCVVTEVNPEKETWEQLKVAIVEG